MIKLTHLPVKDILVTQPFGVNYLNFYKDWGLKGHNGTDLSTTRGADCYATHNGIVTWAGEDSDGGISVTLWNTANGFKTIYYHLQDVTVKVNDLIEGGQLIGHCDNTGKYTTGDHLHLGLKEVDNGGSTVNYDNGYKGAIDPALYLPKNWEQPPVWSGYGNVTNGWNGREWLRERLAKTYLKKNLKRRVGYLEIMAHVYGDWTIDDLQNPSLTWAWMYRTRLQFLRGDELTINVHKYNIT